MPNELLELKRSNFQKALNREEGAYVPNMLTSLAATVAWTGKRAIDLMDDPEAFAENITKVFSEMWVDVNLFCGVMQTQKLQNILPTIENYYGPDGTTLQHVQLSPMKADEYPLLLEDPVKFVDEVLLPRKYPQLYEDREKTKAILKAAAEERSYTFSVLAPAVYKKLEETYGIPLVMGYECIETPLDILFDYFRGFRGTLTDLRRNRANVEAAVKKIFEVRGLPVLQTPFDPSMGFAQQYTHIAPYLSPQQYDELDWPYEMQFIERIAAAGGKAYIMMEGKWEKIWHHFREVPKDSCILQCDDDDFYKLHEDLGDWQILCGGLSSAKIRMGNMDALKDDVKRLIDTCAPGGGFLLATNKNWIAPGDVNKTLVEIYNFAHEYSSKR